MKFKLQELVIPLSRVNDDDNRFPDELAIEIAREALDAFEKKAKERLYGK